jgi:probable phosphoglycerate mutase
MSGPTGNQIWLLRHAETEWSRDGRHTGRTDVPLTENGRARARELNSRVQGIDFSMVLSSPLGRAQDTCKLAGLGEQMQLRDGLLEWDYGDYEGVTTPDIRTERPGWFLWTDGCPNGEQPEKVQARVDEVIEEVLTADGNVALFAHGHILRALGARWLEMPVAAGGRLALSTGSVCVLGFEREVRVMWRWNDTS